MGVLRLVGRYSLGKAIVIGIPLGTRLTGLALVDGEVHVWTGNKCKGKYEDWQGTYLRIEPNGRVSEVVRDGDEDVRYISDFVIKEADNE